MTNPADTIETDLPRHDPSSTVATMEELFRFTLLLRDNVDLLSTRYSEEKERRALGALRPALGVGAKE